jgi:4-hydroxy-tetrahydrodipicolinate synthase
MTDMRMRGVLAAIITPLDKGGAPDAAVFCTLARSLLSGGCDGLNILGTTGEATSFSVAERRGLMEAVAKSGLPLGCMLVGTGAAAVSDAVALTQHASELGFAGALVLPPFYYKNIPDDGVVAYIGALVRSLRGKRLPIYLYNFPALSGVTYSVPLVRRLLAEFPDHIAGLKDSSGNLPYAREITTLDSRLGVFPSTEACLKEARSGVFAGCISATANVNAPLCADAFHRADDEALARAVAVRDAFNGTPLVPAVKSVMAYIHRRADMDKVKPPLQRMVVDRKMALIAEYERLMRSTAPVA